MRNNDIRPEKDCKKVLEGPDQPEVVFAVRDRKADVGTVRTGILERMQRDGKIDLSDFRVLNQVSHEGFPELCSTPLYPEAPFAALKATPQELADRMKKELLSIPLGHPRLQLPRVKRFVEALSYDPLEALCKHLGVEPFKKK